MRYGDWQLIRAHGVHTLQWDGDELADAASRDRWLADGTLAKPSIGRSYGELFDQSAVSPSGIYQALYAQRGTKALLLRDGELIRELNRSYYQAEASDYPLTLAVLPGGRDVVVHCPEEYNELHIDDAATGERLTAGARSPDDVFHSRLAVSPGGRYLLSAGWIWHPFGTITVFDLQQALTEPATLDGPGVVAFPADISPEVESACWLDDDRIVVATASSDVLDRGPQGTPTELWVWSVSAGTWTHRSTVDCPAGTLIGAGDLVVAMCGHPRLIDPFTGQVLAEWPDVSAGGRRTAYGCLHTPAPVTVMHPDATRLAVVQDNGIAVLDLRAGQPQ